MTAENTDHVGNQHSGSARSEFARRLSALHRAAGAPSLRNVAMLVQARANETGGQVRSTLASAQRISDWLSGRNVPARFESLLPVLQVLHARARRHATTPGLAINTRAWRMLWTAAHSAPADATATTTQEPYPVDSYTETHEIIFFGRRRALTALLALVRLSATPQRRADVIILTGASGVGKTSLLCAGLTPALRSDGGRWAVAITTPGSNPLGSFNRIFSVTDDFTACEADLATVRRWAGDARPVLIVDQFEQLYHPEVHPTERADFLNRLKQISTIGTVLVSVRADELASCAEYAWLADALRYNTFTVNPMVRHELLSVITAPVQTCGVSVDPGVVELLLAALESDHQSLHRPATGPGDLAVLSATMRSIWAARTSDRLDVTAYRKIGGPAGDIARRAEALWNELTLNEQIDAKRVLLTLVTLHRDGSFSRRRTPIADLRRAALRTGSGLGLIERLIQGRLIVVEACHADLVHDGLMRWERLRGWIKENRSFLFWRWRIEEDAAEWCTTARDPGLLYRGNRLTAAIQHANDTVSASATEFLHASARAEQRGPAVSDGHDYW